MSISHERDVAEPVLLSPIRWRNVAAELLQTDETLQAQWDALNASRSGPPILASYAVAAALRYFGRGDTRLLIGQQGNSTAAMFLLQRSGPAQWQTFQPSQLPVGTWVAAPGLPLPELARQLIRDPLGAPLILSITQIDPLVAPRSDEGRMWSVGDYVETGWIEITGQFEDYWAQRSKNLRSTLRKQRNKLATDGIQPTMLEYTAVDDMADAVARYSAMESAGWKAEDGTAIRVDNDQGRFYCELLEGAAARGEARVFEYRFDSRTVASNLCIHRDGTLIVLKTTYDQGVDKFFSPAFLLRQDQLARFFATGEYRRLEYYGRFREWQARWTESKRTMYHLTAYRWPLLKTMLRVRRRVQTFANRRFARGEAAEGHL